MPGLGVETDASLKELPRRQIGGLFRSEMWWRDRYRDLEAHGYRLRNRYHPDWEPSWKRSGKDFFDAEDGQSYYCEYGPSGTSSPNNFV
jgi:hypothetical protein